MARARGADVLHDVAYETAYGTPPAGGYFRLPLVSSALGATQGLIEDDRLGKGREGYDPTPDVINNDGDHVVPVDTLAFGFWLKALLGAPDTGDNGDGSYDHVFTSGQQDLPSASIQLFHPRIPRAFVNFGAKANTLRIGMSRSGLLNATIGMVAQGESDHATSQSGTPTEVSGQRFAQATGSVKRAGVELANVVSAEFTYSNALDKVEVIRGDGMIAGADAGVSMMSGRVTMRFADMSMLDAATGRDPIALSFGWVLGDHQLLFEVPRVFLPRVKRPIEGPQGVQATFDWQASGETGPILTVTLTNDRATY